MLARGYVEDRESHTNSLFLASSSVAFAGAMISVRARSGLSAMTRRDVDVRHARQERLFRRGAGRARRPTGAQWRAVVRGASPWRSPSCVRSRRPSKHGHEIRLAVTRPESNPRSVFPLAADPPSRARAHAVLISGRHPAGSARALASFERSHTGASR